MRKLIFLLAVGFLISCSSTRENQSSLYKKELVSLYEIKKIKNEEYFYIIYAARNDSIFKIVSYTDNIDAFYCEKIKAGHSYMLDLKVVFPSDSLFGKSVAPNLGIRSYNVSNGKMVMLERKSHNTIYTALNLIGLCIKNDY